MNSIEYKQLIWWRDVPIDVEWGLLDYLSKFWKGKIVIVCANDFSSERVSCSWKKQGDNHMEFIIGNLDIDINKNKITNLICSDSIHLFSGIRGDHHKFLNLVKKSKDNNCILIMESPSLYGSKMKCTIKKIVYPFLYGFYNLKYGKMFKALLVMGENAKDIYVKYGWEKDKIFEFMYLPKIESIAKKSDNCNSRGLYIGRFDFETKGLKTLMDAIDKMHPRKKWQIDFVGGYGKNKDEVIEWCSKKENVKFLGSWPSDDVIQNMAKYDFCIAPSLYDGWNMTPLQSISAGIGCIISDNAGSTSLIKNSKSGAIFKAGNVNELKQLLEYVIDDNEIKIKWKNNAIQFQKCVCNAAVGEYFVKILRFIFEEGGAPKCPWT